MLRIQPIANAAHAETYYSKSDGGYYDKPDDLRCEWVGRGADLLGLKGSPNYEQFRRLIHGLDPQSGDQLTAKILDNRIPGWDVNVHCPKGVTTVIERGDGRVQDALWEAAREAVADLERYATTRIRKAGQQDDRLTGNLVGYAVEHAETRPAKEDKMPDWHRHIHMVIFNLTYDETEKEWKAVKFRPIMDRRKYFDRRFNQRFSSKVAELGYEIETKWERDARGGRKFIGWDVKGIPETVLDKFSRRSEEVEKLADELGVTSPVAKDKLGATSRLNKRKDLTLDECRDYWDSRLTPEERRQIGRTIEQARLGLNPKLEPAVEKGMEYAIGHHFYNHSVVPLTTLEITAMERSMGAGLPEDVERAAKRQGLLIRDGEATTREVLAEESRIIAFARDGRGTCRPMGDTSRTEAAETLRLSADQKAVLRHIWESADRVIMVEGDAGTGKTDAMKVTIPGISKPGVFLAPSATASRGELRKGGFENADTVTRFLVDANFREQARDGYIYVDEAPLAAIGDIDKVLAKAHELNARVILQGDRKQHSSVQRGSLFPVLEQFAGLPVARLTEIFRQKDPRYKQAVAEVAAGNIGGGFDLLCKLGWVKETPIFDHNRPLVEEYLSAIATPKPNGEMTTAIVVAPTHAEGNEISEEIRNGLKERGHLGREERTFATLKPLGWTEAERGDLGNYAGTEIVQFHRNSGPFKAGERVHVDDLMQLGNRLRPEHFSVFAPAELKLSVGDSVRITSGGKSKDGRHKLDNGMAYRVDGFTSAGDIRLSNGWVLDKGFSHLTHNYVTTSHSSQGRTVDRVMIAMGRESAPAINAEMFYVGISRARDRCTIYSNLSPVLLRQAIQKSKRRKSATELMQGKQPLPRWREKALSFMRAVREQYRQLREKSEAMLGHAPPQREISYVR